MESKVSGLEERNPVGINDSQPATLETCTLVSQSTRF